jgi:hypothetical protein
MQVLPVCLPDSVCMSLSLDLYKTRQDIPGLCSRILDAPSQYR